MRVAEDLTAENVEAALDEYAESRCLKLREQILEHYLPLARHIAGHYGRRSRDLDDLVQVASIGLLKALDRFQPERSGKGFLAYAIPTMRGELKRYLRDHCWGIRIPRPAKNAMLEVLGEYDAVTQKLGGTPTDEQLARHAGLEGDELKAACLAMTCRRVASLDAPLGATATLRLGETLATPDEELENVVDLEGVARAIPSLSARKRTALYLRFYEGLSQREIGEQLGVSQVHVSRLLRDALGQLRKAAEPAFAEAA